MSEVLPYESGSDAHLPQEGSSRGQEQAEQLLQGTLFTLKGQLHEAKKDRDQYSDGNVARIVNWAAGSTMTTYQEKDLEVKRIEAKIRDTEEKLMNFRQRA